MKTEIWNSDLQNGRYKNPILYTDYSDPDAIRVGEDYYMIASSFCNAPGIPLLHSRDLVNWEIINYILPKLPGEQFEKPRHGCGVWAPAIRYHDGTFFVCFPMPDEGIYMSTSKDPYGSFSEPVNIREGSGWIDPCPFWDDDGRAYLVAGVAKSRIGYKSVLHLVEMAPDGMSLIGEEKVVFDGNQNGQETIEGPKLYKRNGYYYIFAPAGGVKGGWQSVLRSKQIKGPYECRVVMEQKDTSVNGPHQGALLDTDLGESWFLHFQDVYCAGRIVHLQPVSWENDWPIIGAYEIGETCGKPVMEYTKPKIKCQSVERMEPETSDQFTGKELSLQWQWNANPDQSWYDLDGESLNLRSVTTKENVPYGDLPNLLLQKWPAPEFACEYRMDLSSLMDGDEAGVISMGMTYALLTFQRVEEQIQISFIKGVQRYGKIMVDHTDEEKIVLDTKRFPKSTEFVVKYTVDQIGMRKVGNEEAHFPLEKVTFFVKIGDGEFVEAGSYEPEPGRWVGVKNGLFCIRKGCKGGGHLSIKEVKYDKKKE